MQQNKFTWPLINDNINEEDKDCLVNFIKTPGVRFTQHTNVKNFEKEWSKWLGSKNTVYVNSGASANWIMAAIIKEKYGLGEIIMSPFGWVSDVVPFLALGFDITFVDVDPKTMSSDNDLIMDAITEKTKAVLMVHVLGFNGLDQPLIDLLKEKDIPLIEDCCESHGAKFGDKKVGTLGQMSNFSFYFGHHMTTIEGGVVFTDDDEILDLTKMFRSHGMTREASEELKKKYINEYPKLNPLFTFAVPGFNVRSHELCAVVGLNQLKRLDQNIAARQKNLDVWLQNLNSGIFYTDYYTEGSSNFALPLVLNNKETELFDRVCRLLEDEGVEYRLGTAGGGNQIEQPYLKSFEGKYKIHGNLKNLDQIHEFGLYIGNHPELEEKMIVNLCNLLNSLGEING